jgi:hypothetical protein
MTPEQLTRLRALVDGWRISAGLSSEFRAPLTLCIEELSATIAELAAEPQPACPPDASDHCRRRGWCDAHGPEKKCSQGCSTTVRTWCDKCREWRPCSTCTYPSDYFEPRAAERPRQQGWDVDDIVSAPVSCQQLREHPAPAHESEPALPDDRVKAGWWVDQRNGVHYLHCPGYSDAKAWVADGELVVNVGHRLPADLARALLRMPPDPGQADDTRIARAVEALERAKRYCPNHDDINAAIAVLTGAPQGEP